ncbi:MAG: dihydrolipoamide acetyltransferase family protein [Acidimicrobiales bacterium]
MGERVFDLPDVGEGLVEAEIVEWKVAVGDVVALNQPVVDIETAKATVELPSPYAGVVKALHGAPGDVIEVDQPLITFEVEGAGDAPAAPAAPAASAPEPATAAPEEKKREAVLIGYGVADEDAVPTRRHRRQGAAAPATPPSVPAVTATSAPALASRSTPPVRLYAKQHGLDIANVAGTGRDGLITRDDVERALSGPSARPGVAIAAPTTTSRFVGHDLAPWDSGPAEERIPVKGVLRAMAEAMTQSAFSAPHAAVWVRVDVTRMVELLASLKAHPRLQGLRLSPMTITALALCDAARHFPGVNSSFDAGAQEVVVRRVVNLGIAADTPKGLTVPNIKSADRLGLVDMAGAINDLVDKARVNATTPAEMIGTTITITNVGPMRVDAAIPILPLGTGAILAIGTVTPSPWVVNGEVVVRQVMELAMSFDHRMIDGAMASRVLRHVAEFLEDPAPAMIVG